MSVNCCYFFMCCSPTGRCRNYARMCVNPHTFALQHRSMQPWTIIITSSSSNWCTVQHSSVRASCTVISLKCALKRLPSSWRLTASLVVWYRWVNFELFTGVHSWRLTASLVVWYRWVNFELFTGVHSWRLTASLVVWYRWVNFELFTGVHSWRLTASLVVWYRWVNFELFTGVPSRWQTALTPFIVMRCGLCIVLIRYNTTKSIYWINS